MFTQTYEQVKYFADSFAEGHPKLKMIKAERLFESDKAALACARALLFNRLPEGETFTLRFYNYERIPAIQDVKNSLNIFFSNEGSCPQEKIDTFTKTYEMMTSLDKHVEFLKKYMNCKIFINEDLNSAVLFIDEINTRKAHLAMSFFGAYFPKLFEKGLPLTTDEQTLCLAMAARTSDQFNAAIDLLAKDFDLEREWRSDLLRKYTKNNIKRMIEKAERREAELSERVEENMREYRALYNEFYEARMQTQLLKDRPVDEDRELLDYFARNKSVQLFDIDGDTLKFYVMSTLEWFDLDFYKRSSANGAIYRLDGAGPFEEEENRKLLMDAIFSDDPKFRIRICAEYDLSLTTGVEVHRNVQFPKEITDCYIPNPHLQYHACLGNHMPAIRTAIRENDMIKAIEQCIASAQSVNLAERGATFDPFMTDVFKNKNKILIDNDGNEYTPREALNKLKETA